MKKISFLLTAILLITSIFALTANAASLAPDASAYRFNEIYSNSIDEDFDPSEWSWGLGICNPDALITEDGWLLIGENSSGWTGSSIAATLEDQFADLTKFEFDYKSKGIDAGCYMGFGFRVPAFSDGGFYGGGRGGVDGVELDTAYGIAMDLWGKNTGKIVITFCNESLVSLVDKSVYVSYPEGYDPFVSNHYIVYDFNDKLTLVINDKECFTIVFGDGDGEFYRSAAVYDQNGTQIGSNISDIEIGYNGAFQIFQRNNQSFLDNLVVSRAIDPTAPTPSPIPTKAPTPTKAPATEKPTVKATDTVPTAVPDITDEADDGNDLVLIIGIACAAVVVAVIIVIIVKKKRS